MNADCWRIVQLPSDIQADYETEAPEKTITGLSRLNVFIGPNNAGKSRLLRSLFHNDCYYTAGHDEQAGVLEALAAMKVMLGNAPSDDQRKVNDLLTTLVPLLRRDGGEFRQFVSQDTLNHFRGEMNRRPQVWGWSETEVNEFRTHLNSLTHRLRPQPANSGGKIDAIDVYIPALRGLRPPQQPDGQCYWLDRTNTDYFADRIHKGATAELATAARTTMIITGAEFYRLLQGYLLGPLDRRKLVAEYQAYLSNTFFNGSDVTLLPRLDSSVLYVKIGQTEERPIHHLGDGIQQIIVLTFPLFVFKDKNLRLFIEEPELFLHPGYQRLLIDAFLSNPDRALQVFVATHSHQFMDITIDEDSCTVFKVNRKIESGPRDTHLEKFAIHRSSSSDFETLRLLGVRNSSVLLSNCTIWVEGVTDRRYLRRYLELVQAQEKTLYREDIEFSFVEYSGSNVTHWSFLDPVEGIDVSRICSPLFIILDSDAADDTTEKGKRFKTLRKNLGKNVCVLPVREVENLLSGVVLEKVVQDYEGDGCSVVRPDEAQFQQKYLGEFIETKMVEGKSKRRTKAGSGFGPYSDKSGTIKDKSRFCERALSHIQSINDMSQAAIKVTKQLLAFIRQNN